MNEVIAIKPLTLSVLPVRGKLYVIVNPFEVLANPDGPMMLADVLASLEFKRGGTLIANSDAVADYLSRLIADERVEQGQQVLLQTHTLAIQP